MLRLFPFLHSFVYSFHSKGKTEKGNHNNVYFYFILFEFNKVSEIKFYGIVIFILVCFISSSANFRFKLHVYWSTFEVGWCWRFPFLFHYTKLFQLLRATKVIIKKTTSLPRKTMSSGNYGYPFFTSFFLFYYWNVSFKLKMFN